MRSFVKKLVVPCALLALSLGACKPDDPVNPPTTTTGTITGVVTDYSTGQPIAGVQVSSTPPSQSVTTNASGQFAMENVATGSYAMMAAKAGYETGTVNVTVLLGKTTVADIVLKRSGGSDGNSDGKVLYFDGEDDHCLVPYASDFELDEGSFTLESWVKPTVMTHWDCILTRGVSDDNADFLMILDLNRLRGQSRNLDNLVYGVRRLEPNNWYHVAVVQDAAAGTMSLYVDGVLDKVEPLKGTPRNPRNDVFIGAREYFGSGRPAEGFQGFLREMRVWNVARSASQLNAARLRTLVGNETGLVAYWPMNEGQGTSIADKSGRGHAGSIRYGANWSTSSLPF